MAVDTQNERASILCYCLPFGRVYPEPDASAYDSADEAFLLLLYVGILATAPVVEVIVGKGHPKEAWVWGGIAPPPELDYAAVTEAALRDAAMAEMRTIDTMIDGLERGRESEIESIRGGTFERVKDVLESSLSERAYLEERRIKAKKIADKPKLEALEKARAVRQANLDRKAAIKKQRLKNLAKARKAKKRKAKKK